ncbi:hypothetical protein EYR38_007415 [Pleurotus pulmonarius]|nr:hypothetical protein EYR38_007415 [Pleurotus pulmonarius]
MSKRCSQDRVDAPPDQDVIDHQRLRDRLEAVVREKEGKLINISNPLPFNFHNRPVIPTAYDASSSRSTSASVERYHYSSHYPSRETEPGPSAPMLAPSHSNYLLDNTGHAIGGDTDSDEAHGRALQAHIRNPILGIRLVEPADAVKGKGVEGERGRGAWAHTPVPSTSGPREQESGASFADGPHGDLDAEDEEMTPRASALVAKTQAFVNAPGGDARSSVIADSTFTPPTGIYGFEHPNSAYQTQARVASLTAVSPKTLLPTRRHPTVVSHEYFASFSHTMRYLNFYNRKFIKLQSCSLGMLQGMAFVFFAAELYATAVLVYVRAPPAAPTIGLFTAFLTIISARAVLSSFPDAFLKTVLFQTVWPPVLLALWLLTATSHHDLSATLAPHGCDALPAGLTLMVYIAVLSVLTVRALEADHPDVWRASTWELPHTQGAPPGKSNGGEDAPAAQ